MYNSPIELLVTDIENEIVKQQDEEIYRAVLHYVPNVDKEELLRALQYDREQYEKGYLDGKADSKPAWIPVSERLPKPFEIVYVYDCTIKMVTNAYLTRHQEWVGVNMKHEVTHWMPLPEPPQEKDNGNK